MDTSDTRPADLPPMCGWGGCTLPQGHDDRLNPGPGGGHADLPRSDPRYIDAWARVGILTLEVSKAPEPVMWRLGFAAIASLKDDYADHGYEVTIRFPTEVGQSMDSRSWRVPDWEAAVKLANELDAKVRPVSDARESAKRQATELLHWMRELDKPKSPFIQAKEVSV